MVALGGGECTEMKTGVAFGGSSGGGGSGGDESGGKGLSFQDSPISMWWWSPAVGRHSLT